MPQLANVMIASTSEALMGIGTAENPEMVWKKCVRAVSGSRSG